jgi:malate dehydrogenase (oxaloacetate-decarboxylating)
MILPLSPPNHLGWLARIATAIERAKGVLRSVKMADSDGVPMVRDLTFASVSERLQFRIVRAPKRLEGVVALSIGDQVLSPHRGGKGKVKNKFSLNTGGTLGTAYTPGVARVCKKIALNLQERWLPP